MIPELAADQWLAQSDPAECERIVRGTFGEGYAFDRWQQTFAGTRVAVFQDREFGLDWVVAPGGSFFFGLTEQEQAAALKLSAQPLLSIEEMQPARLHSVPPFLVMHAPVTAPFAQRHGVAIIEEVEAADVGAAALFHDAQALEIALACNSALPTELEWEYACRAGGQTLFWFGDSVLPEDTMSRILGLDAPVVANRFGLCALFFGEVCADYWRKSHDPKATEDRSAGRVVKGGAARFWPWHDDREWSGCVSSYRLSILETGGAGVAARLVRRPIQLAS